MDDRAAVFYYDLGSPGCYLAAEQVIHALRPPVEWEPVAAGQVGHHEETCDQARIEFRAAELGLQEVRWPPTLPVDSRRCMVAAAYAKQIGRAVSFSLAAFRQAFAAGRDLAEDDTILIAGAACEIHPTALLSALARPSVQRSLKEATQRAREAGVRELPAVAVGVRLFQGPDALAQAATTIASSA